MTQVKCIVASCSNNKDGDCHISTVNIGGKGATSEELTCCGSFLNRHSYSNLAEYTSLRGEANSVSCKVDTCKYNKANYCSLEEIQVGGNEDASIYTETDCLSFEER